jgi:ABC-type polysaccharide/polyol phosphate transport system ATPase subunit
MKPSIQFINVSKRYRVGQSVPNLRSMVAGWHKNGAEKYHWALRDLTFELMPGESLGIIGPNGAGKTTTLKLLSRVTYPSSGMIAVNGRFSALIELGAGFHPDLTGRENIYLNGTILGMQRAEIQARFDEIVDFAEIGNYLDTPVKRYSSGMYARLGFSVAAHIYPEVLLVDEVLAVGDMAFQKKCYERMVSLIKEGTTLIFVSHNMRAIQEVCRQSIVLYRGRKVYQGDTADATAEYSNILRQAAAEYRDTGEVDSGISQRIMTHAAIIDEVQLLRSDGTPAITFDSGENALVRMKVNISEAIKSPIAACRITTPTGQVIYDFTTHWAHINMPDFQPNTQVVFEFPLEMNLVDGTYYLGVNLAYQDLSRYYDRIDRAVDFVISGGKGARGIADLHANFNIIDEQRLEPDIQ